MRLSVETMLEEIKSVVMKKHDFENRGKTKVWCSGKTKRLLNRNVFPLSQIWSSQLILCWKKFNTVVIEKYVYQYGDEFIFKASLKNFGLLIFASVIRENSINYSSTSWILLVETFWVRLSSSYELTRKWVSRIIIFDSAFGFVGLTIFRWGEQKIQWNGSPAIKRVQLGPWWGNDGSYDKIKF